MAKARVAMYGTKGDALSRTHKFCPKCGVGTFLAEHSDRRSCGRCGYMETKVREAAPAPSSGPVAAKPAKGEGKPPRPKTPKPAAAPAAPAPPSPPA